MNNLNPQDMAKDWINTLKQAVDSRTSRSSQEGGPKYVSLVEGRGYTLINRSQMDDQHEKCPLEDIVNRTHEQLLHLDKSYSKGEIKGSEYLALSDNMVKYTESLVKAKEEKRNQVENVILRGVAYVVAGIASLVFGLGIPLFRKLRKLDEKFSQEIMQFKQTLENDYKQVCYQVNPRLKIDDQIHRIPEILEELGAEMTDNDRLDLFTNQLVKDYPSNYDLNYVTQFKKDMERRGAFFRKDKDLSINDTTPQPAYQLDSDKRLEIGVSLLNDLLKEETSNKQNWNYALQLVTNQTTVSVMLGEVIGKVSTNYMDNDTTWVENGKDYLLRAAFSETTPPIGLEIIRDPKTKQIKRVNVEMFGYVDVISSNVRNNRENSVIASEAIKGTLSYSMELDKKGRPIISNFKTKIEANLGKPKRDAASAA